MSVQKKLFIAENVGRGGAKNRKRVGTFIGVAENATTPPQTSPMCLLWYLQPWLGRSAGHHGQVR